MICRVVDLFAGAGGWDLAAVELGLDVVGLELWDVACATRAAAGLPTVRCDVSAYPPEAFAVGGVEGLIASPPCPDWSAAGSRTGRDGKTGWLVDEPLRWALALRPRWLAFEQVPAALVAWRQHAAALREAGYSVWCGVLNAADFGVPQTRQRAILLAHRDRAANPPEPTHARDPQPSLFGQLERWVSMAAALGLGGVNTGRDWKPGGSREDAQVIGGERPAPSFTAKAGGQWHVLDMPATTVTGDPRLSPRCHHEDGPSQSGGAVTVDELLDGKVLRAGRSGNFRKPVRTMDEPAPTAYFGKHHHEWEFVDADPSWVWERPATTVMADSRVWPPGHKVNGDDRRRLGQEEADERYGDRAGTTAVRLTIGQALALQTFPTDWPLAGNKTDQFTQVGNAVPPLLALRLLERLVG